MNNDNQKIITRFAPSPTGPLHIGGARTALFNYLYTRQNKGTFLLRIEDTDKERSKQEFTDVILESLKLLGLNYDGISYQSQNTEVYKQALQKLIDEGKAYVSKEENVGDPSKGSGRASRTEVIRFKNPNIKITFNDLIRGEITFDTTDLGDFVLAKSLEEPLYHLANVVDDINSGVTHIIRGEDHISNTPRQILIMEALGGARPTYAHIPLILAPDKSKLSKRHGAVAVTEYIAEGYLPAAFVNFIAMMGWNPGTDQEIFSLEELVKTFDLAKVQKGGAVFNVEKLNWLNREYIKKMPAAEQLAKVKKYLPDTITSASGFNDDKLKRALPSIIDRINRFHDVATQAAFGEYDCFFNPPNYPKALLKNQNHFEEIIMRVEGLSADNFTAEKVKNAIWDYATEQGKGEVLWPMRVALSGKEKSPDPFTIAEVIGKAETLTRLQHAANLA